MFRTNRGFSAVALSISALRFHRVGKEVKKRTELAKLIINGRKTGPILKNYEI